MAGVKEVLAARRAAEEVMMVVVVVVVLVLGWEAAMSAPLMMAVVHQEVLVNLGKQAELYCRS
jgi:hypothetical protein